MPRDAFPYLGHAPGPADATARKKLLDFIALLTQLAGSPDLSYQAICNLLMTVAVPAFLPPDCEGAGMYVNPPGTFARHRAEQRQRTAKAARTRAARKRLRG